MYITIRAISDTVCPPTFPPSCKPSVGPGPAMVESQNAEALLREPNLTDNATPKDPNAGSEAEINAVGVVVIIFILLILFCLWAGLAGWPRGKIKVWIKHRSEKRIERARQKALSAMAKNMASTASAVDLTPADIESAVSMINNNVAKGQMLAVGPALPLEKNVSSSSASMVTVVEEEDRIPVKGSPDAQDSTTPSEVPLSLPESNRAIVRDSSWQILLFMRNSQVIYSRRALQGMFTQSRTVAFSRKVNCTVEKALTILHNPIDLIDLNPLVVHREQSATDPALWNIRDRLSTLGLKYEFNYTARATPLEDGALFEINAPLGIVLRNKWTVTPAGEGVVEMKEDVEVITNCLLMSSVLRDLKKAHEVMHDTLAAQMEGRSVDAKKAPQPSGEQVSA
ncbi:hypothetical protein EUX98_g46 [Antrodiella citrinella]|uniref:DUF7053 domain-containing protein n=1 Tax=Antrodiella citrinella TaxID=2447956 RepID=A0A4S4N533_9APHY|nr:hypothetical protein EUX98_g46 [Antrodiella citrinella]